MKKKRSSPALPTRPAGVGSWAMRHESENWLERACRHLSPWVSALWLLAQILAIRELVRCYTASEIANGRTNIVAGVFIALKTCMAIIEAIALLWKLPIMSQRFFPPKLRVLEDEQAVDVIICCCGEDEELILNTIKAACELDYPTDLLRIIVGDDGDSPTLRAGVVKMRERYPNLHYHSRKDIWEREGGKAGNINACVEFARTLPGVSADWFAVLDCDMISEIDWLRAIIAPGIVDAAIALVDCDQGFYNLPTNDPLAQSRDSRLDESCRNSLGVADCGGTGFAVRRAAYDDLGGFPESSVAEDILFSHLLHRRGWKTISLGETLQWGLMPQNLSGHVAQRRKWMVGRTQNGLLLGHGLDFWRLSKLSLLQRLEVFVYSTAGISQCLVRPIGYLCIPVCVVLSGGKLVLAPSQRAFRRFLILHCLERLTFELMHLVETPFSGYHQQRSHKHASRWLMPLFWLDILRTLRFATGKHDLKFEATGRMRSRLNERGPQRCSPLSKRLKSVVLERPFWLNTIIIVTATIALTVSIGHAHTGTLDPESADNIWYRLLRGPLFPGIGWMEYISFLSPLLYMAWPPVSQDWKTMLDTDQKGTRRPKSRLKGVSWSYHAHLLSVPPLLSLGWSVLACFLVPDHAVVK